MTDPRNRVTTDPGLGPIERENASTLRSMTAAEPVPDEEIPGSPVYYEPKPLHAVSDHKTLELETVKLAKDIDPRKLPTELKLRRPVLHVLPASDPNWPAPASSPQPPDLRWPSPLHDSNWPPPETVLTTSQPPLAARRSYIPLVLFVLLSATLLLVFGARAWRRAPVSSLAAQPATLAAAPSPRSEQALPSAAPPSASSEGTLPTSASALPADSAELPAIMAASAVTSATSAESSVGAGPAPHHAPFKSIAPSAPSSIANSSALSAPPTAKPKRAIY